MDGEAEVSLHKPESGVEMDYSTLEFQFWKCKLEFRSEDWQDSNRSPGHS